MLRYRNVRIIKKRFSFWLEILLVYLEKHHLLWKKQSYKHDLSNAGMAECFTWLNISSVFSYLRLLWFRKIRVLLSSWILVEIIVVLGINTIVWLKKDLFELRKSKNINRNYRLNCNCSFEGLWAWVLNYSHLIVY